MSRQDSHKNPLNINKIKTLIDSGIQCIPIDKHHQQAVIVIGDTGVGKSTILSFLSGKQMVVKFNGIKVSLDTVLENSRTRIGHTKISQTFMPTKIIIDRVVFFDCPGFNDNKGQQFQLANSFFLQRLFTIYNKIKIVLVIDQSHISQVRAEKLPKLLHNILQIFGTFKNIIDGCCMIVSRADPQATKQDYEYNGKGNESHELFKQEACMFLQELARKNRVYIFRQPAILPSLENTTQILQTYNPYRYIPSQYQQQILPKILSLPPILHKKRSTKLLISHKTKLAIRQLIDSITVQANNRIQLLCLQINNYYMKNKGLFVIFNSKEVNKQNINKAIKIKQELNQLIQKINDKKSNRFQILEPLQQFHNNNCNLTTLLANFNSDFTVIKFFKQIHNREQQYFNKLTNILNKQLLTYVNQIQMKVNKMQHSLTVINKEEEDKINKEISGNMQEIQRCKQEQEEIMKKEKLQILKQKQESERQLEMKQSRKKGMSQVDCKNIQEKQQEIKKIGKNKEKQLEESRKQYKSAIQSKIKIKQEQNRKKILEALQLIEEQQLKKQRVIQQKNKQTAQRTKQRNLQQYHRSNINKQQYNQNNNNNLTQYITPKINKQTRYYTQQQQTNDASEDIAMRNNNIDNIEISNNDIIRSESYSLEKPSRLSPQSVSSVASPSSPIFNKNGKNYNNDNDDNNDSQLQSKMKEIINKIKQRRQQQKQQQQNKLNIDHIKQQQQIQTTKQITKQITTQITTQINNDKQNQQSKPVNNNTNTNMKQRYKQQHLLTDKQLRKKYVYDIIGQQKQKQIQRKAQVNRLLKLHKKQQIDKQLLTKSLRKEEVKKILAMNQKEGGGEDYMSIKLKDGYVFNGILKFNKLQRKESSQERRGRWKKQIQQELKNALEPKIVRGSINYPNPERVINREQSQPHTNRYSSINTQHNKHTSYKSKDKKLTNLQQSIKSVLQSLQEVSSDLQKVKNNATILYQKNKLIENNSS